MIEFVRVYFSDAGTFILTTALAAIVLGMMLLARADSTLRDD